MKRSHQFLVLIAALAVVCSGLIAVHGQVGRARPTAAAVVDVQTVFNQLEEREAIKVDLQKLADNLKREQEEMSNKLKQMREDLEFMDKSQQGYEDLVNKIERQQVALQGFTKYAEAKLEMENVRRIELIYNKMRKTIEQVAQEDGYHLVLFKEVETDEGKVKFPGANMKEINRAIENRKVIWASPDIDITERVKTRMNNDFKARPTS